MGIWVVERGEIAHFIVCRLLSKWLVNNEFSQPPHVPLRKKWSVCYPLLWMSWRKGVEEMILTMCGSLCATVSVCVLDKNDCETQCPLQCSLFSHAIHWGPPFTHCFSQFTFRTCPSHLFVAHAVLLCPCFSLLLAACFFKIWFLFLPLTPLSVLDSHSSSVSSHLPENFTIALNDTWVSFDSLSSPDRNSDGFASPDIVLQAIQYLLLCAYINSFFCVESIFGCVNVMSL